MVLNLSMQLIVNLYYELFTYLEQLLRNLSQKLQHCAYSEKKISEQIQIRQPEERWFSFPRDNLSCYL